MEDPLVGAQRYRDRAATIRAMAEIEADEKTRTDLLALADQYDGLTAELLAPAPRHPQV